MQALFSTLLIIFFALEVSAGAGQRHRRWSGHGFSVNTSNDPNSDTCADHLRIWSDEYSGEARAEEEKVVPKQPLKITAADNGGIHVKQWSRSEIGIKVCKAAIASTDSEAQQLISQVALAVEGGDVTIHGPSDDTGRWSALLIVHVPTGAQLDLNAHNGGISFRRVSVNATAHTVNGGISLHEASGQLEMEAQNGGVSVTDCNGDIKINVQNGGVALKLGETWSGAGLEARTHNGGLSVEVPANFRSSLEVAGSRHSPIICKGNVCDRGQRAWNNEDDRILRFGTGDPVIRTSTINGGVVVKNRGASDRDVTKILHTGGGVNVLHVGSGNDGDQDDDDEEDDDSSII